MTIQHEWDSADRGRLASVKAADWWPAGGAQAAHVMPGPAGQPRVNAPTLNSPALSAASLNAPAIAAPGIALPRPMAPDAGVVKRAFDIVFALVLLVPLSVLMVVVAAMLLVKQGRPILYAAPRMKSPTEDFTQWKFRTMVCDDGDSGASGAHKNWRITGIGHVLRRTRIDELPQLFNILRGDMSFVGPRPPLREYVERFPLGYARTLQSRPGVTGLATLIYHRHEDRIMAACTTAEATEDAYYRRCLPMKLRIDTLYLQHRSLRLDLWIIWQTVATVLTNADVGTRKRRRLARRRIARRGFW